MGLPWIFSSGLIENRFPSCTVQNIGIQPEQYTVYVSGEFMTCHLKIKDDLLYEVSKSVNILSVKG